MSKRINDNTWIIFAVFFIALFIAVAVATGCQEKNWTSNPEEWKTPPAKAKSIETATVGVIVDKKTGGGIKQ